MKIASTILSGESTMSSQVPDTKQNGSAHIIIIAAIVIVVVAGAGVLVATKTLGKHKIVTSQADLQQLFADVKADKYDAKCTFTATTTESSAALSINSGTLYIAGNGKKRIDGSINNKPAHVVQQSDSVYIWADGSKEGSLFPVTKSDSQSLSDKLTSSPEKYTLACQDVGRLDDSTFAIPSSVKFIDINQSLKSQSSTSGN